MIEKNIIKKIKTITNNYEKHHVIQTGGFVGGLVAIGQFVGQLGVYIVVGFFELLRKFFYIPAPYEVEWWDIGGWEAGAFWRYIWWCIKSVCYLMIFAMGGPIITIIGIFFLYKNLASKFGEGTDEKMYEENMGEQDSD